MHSKTEAKRNLLPVKDGFFFNKSEETTIRMATMGRKINPNPGNNTKKLKIKDAIAVFDSFWAFI